jgi:hypothetical protein
LLENAVARSCLKNAVAESYSKLLKIRSCLKNVVTQSCVKNEVAQSCIKTQLLKVALLIYLCGTTTNIWLRPVQEDLSMTACLEHSASNLWPLGPGYHCSPHPPTWISVFLDFSFQWVWLWIELFVKSLRVFWSCDQRSAIYLSSWH